MSNAIFVVFLLCLALLIVRSVQKTRKAAARITADPDPTRVAIMQYEAITMALATVETLQEPAEVKAKRRQLLLEKRQNLQLALAP